MRILIVEDEIRLAEALAQILSQNNYITDMVHNGTDGLDYAMSGIYDAIVLDIMLPGMNGFDVVKQMRKNKMPTPVIMLTAKDEVSDKVKGLDCGADDYLTKPFASEELLARIRALTRRKDEAYKEESVFADLSLDTKSLLLSCGTKSVHLGLKEAEVLRLLIEANGSTVSKEQLLLKVWGSESDAEDNNVEVYISFLRKKLGYLKSAASIATVRKIGYHLEAEPS
ncbi:MAG: response regulator transcription factor [Anaerofustis sp.]|jgi:DNA-binding response OmpR family regulator